MKHLTWILLSILLASCASKKIMKDCEKLQGDFWECEDP